MQCTAIKSKVCYRCKATKPLHAFYHDRTRQDGKSNICRECSRASRKSLNDKNRLRTAVQIPDTKRCPLCQQTKSSIFFWKDKSNKDGLEGWCKECRTSSGNKRRLRLSTRTVIQNPGTKRCTNCGQVKAGTCFSKNLAVRSGLDSWCKECTVQYGAAYRQTNRGMAIHMFNGSKSRARDRGIPFNLDVDYIESIFPSPLICPLLGIEMEHNTNKQDGTSPSLDRIVPNLGYTKGNVMIVSYKANTIKSNATVDEILTVGKNLKKYLERNSR